VANFCAPYSSENDETTHNTIGDFQGDLEQLFKDITFENPIFVLNSVQFICV